MKRPSAIAIVFLISMIASESFGAKNSEPAVVTPFKSSSCSYTLTIRPPKVRQALTVKQAKIAVTALENAGETVNISIFKRYNPKLNAIISSALGTPVDMDQLYQTLSMGTSIVDARRRLFELPDKAEAPAPKPKAKLKSNVAARTQKLPVMPQESAGGKKPTSKSISKSVKVAVNKAEIQSDRTTWLKSSLIAIAHSGRKPNVIGLIGVQNGMSLLQVAKLTYNGSLYDAVKDCGLDVSDIFQTKQAATPQSASVLAQRLADLGQRLKRQPAQLDEVIDAVATEFSSANMPLVKVILKLLATTDPKIAFHKTLNQLADESSIQLNQPISTQSIERIIQNLARNRTLAAYLDA